MKYLRFISDVWIKNQLSYFCASCGIKWILTWKWETCVRNILGNYQLRWDTHTSVVFSSLLPKAFHLLFLKFVTNIFGLESIILFVELSDHSGQTHLMPTDVFHIINVIWPVISSRVYLKILIGLNSALRSLWFANDTLEYYIALSCTITIFYHCWTLWSIFYRSNF